MSPLSISKLIRQTLPLALFAVVVFADKSQAQQQRPNVLFIAIDDLRPEIGAFGANRAVTPNLDRIAAESVRFDRAYVTYPLCLPSRASMLTGRRINYSGEGKRREFATLIDLQKTIPRVLRENGYWTATVGKIYHGNVPKRDQDAWDVPGPGHPDDTKAWSPELMQQIVGEWGPKEVVQEFRTKGGGSGSLLAMALDVEDDRLPDGKIGNVALSYLKDRPENKPFAIFVGFHLPHMPWVAPKKYFDLYKDTKIILPTIPEGAEREILKEDRGAGVSKDGAQWNEGVSDDEARDLIKGYLAGVSYVDAQIGRLIDQLKSQGLEKDTIIVVWGDHGYHLTDHGLWRKNTIYHVANRIPFMIHVPGKSAGVSERLVESIDIYPTLLALTSTPDTGLRLDGRSLVPLLENPSAEWNYPAFIHAGAYKGIVTDQYRYAISDTGNRPEKLFDLKVDPEEWNNLADDPSHAGRIAEFRTLISKAWEGDQVAPGSVETDQKPTKKKKKDSETPASTNNDAE